MFPLSIINICNLERNKFKGKLLLHVLNIEFKYNAITILRGFFSLTSDND